MPSRPQYGYSAIRESQRQQARQRQQQQEFRALNDPDPLRRANSAAMLGVKLPEQQAAEQYQREDQRALQAEARAIERSQKEAERLNAASIKEQQREATRQQKASFNDEKNRREAAFVAEKRPTYIDASGMIQPKQSDEEWAGVKRSEAAATKATGDLAVQKRGIDATEKAISEVDSQFTLRGRELRAAATAMRRAAAQAKSDAAPNADALKAEARAAQQAADDASFQELEWERNKLANKSIATNAQTLNTAAKSQVKDLKAGKLPADTNLVVSPELPKPLPDVPGTADTANERVIGPNGQPVAPPKPGVGDLRMQEASEAPDRVPTLQEQFQTHQAEKERFTATAQAATRPRDEVVAKIQARGIPEPLIQLPDGTLGYGAGVTEEEKQMLRLAHQAVQKHAPALDAQSREINARASQLQAQAQEESIKFKAQRDAEMARMRTTPGMAQTADQVAKLDADFEAVRSKLDPQNSEEDKVALQAITERYQQEREAALGSAQENQHKMREALNAARLQVRDETKAEIDALASGPDYGSMSADASGADFYKELEARNLAKLAEEGKKFGLTPEQTQNIVSDLQKETEWTGVGVKDDDARVLSTGAVAVNPKLWIDPAKYRKAVESTDAPPEAKARALEMVPELEKQALAALLPSIRSAPGFHEFALKNGAAIFIPGYANLSTYTPEELAAEQAKSKFKDGAELVKAYRASPEGNRWWANNAQQAVLGMASGTLGMAQQATGGFAAITGNKKAANLALDASKAMEQAGGASAAMTSGQWTNKLAQGATSIVPALAGGLLVRGLGAAAGVKNGTVLAQQLGLSGSAGAAAAQSFGGTWTEAYDANIKQGMSHEEARAQALVPAIASGLATAAVTYGFGATGTESAFAADQFRKTGKDMIKALAKGSGQEFTEEALDQVMQGVIASITYNPGKPIGEIIAEALEAGAIGGVLGGGMTAASNAGAPMQVNATGDVEGGSDTAGPDSPLPPDLADPPKATFQQTADLAGSEAEIERIAQTDPALAAQAETIREIASGTTLDQMTDAQLASVGVTRNPKGEVVNVKPKQGEPAPAVKIENGQPIITQPALDALERQAPRTRSLVQMDETEARARISQQQTESPAPTDATVSGTEATGEPRGSSTQAVAVPAVSGAEDVAEGAASDTPSGVAPATPDQPPGEESLAPRIDPDQALPGEVVREPQAPGAEAVTVPGSSGADAAIAPPTPGASTVSQPPERAVMQIAAPLVLGVERASGKSKAAGLAGRAKLLSEVVKQTAKNFTGIRFVTTEPGTSPAALAPDGAMEMDVAAILSTMTAKNPKDARAWVESVVDEEFKHRVALDLERSSPEFAQNLTDLYASLPDSVKEMSRAAYFAQIDTPRQKNQFPDEFNARHEFFRQYWQSAKLQKATESALTQKGMLAKLRSLIASFLKELRRIQKGAKNPQVKAIADRLIAQAEAKVEELRGVADKTDETPANKQKTTKSRTDETDETVETSKAGGFVMTEEYVSAVLDALSAVELPGTTISIGGSVSGSSGRGIKRVPRDIDVLLDMDSDAYFGGDEHPAWMFANQLAEQDGVEVWVRGFGEVSILNRGRSASVNRLSRVSDNAAKGMETAVPVKNAIAARRSALTDLDATPAPVSELPTYDGPPLEGQPIDEADRLETLAKQTKNPETAEKLRGRARKAREKKVVEPPKVETPQRDVFAGVDESAFKTPLMRQWADMRKELPSDTILAIRLGDLYELFAGDAIEGAKAMNVALTKRNGIPMAGYPHHAQERYIASLKEAGWKVAVIEDVAKATQSATPEKPVRKSKRKPNDTTPPPQEGSVPQQPEVSPVEKPVEAVGEVSQPVPATDEPVGRAGSGGGVELRGAKRVGAMSDAEDVAIIRRALREHFGFDGDVEKLGPGLYKAGRIVYGLYTASKVDEKSLLNGIPVGSDQILLREQDDALSEPKQKVSEVPARSVDNAKDSTPDTMAEEVATPEVVKQSAPLSSVSAKEQKKFLLDEIEKAIKDAPDSHPSTDTDADADRSAIRAAEQDALKRITGTTGADVAQRADFVVASLGALIEKYNVSTSVPAYVGTLAVDGKTKIAPDKEAGERPANAIISELYDKVRRAHIDQLPHVTIEVPGDGVFSILNTKSTLKEFQKKAQKFPVTTPRQDAAPSTGATGPTTVPALKKPKDNLEIVKAVTPFASEDAARHVINGVYSNGENMIATDGRRIIVVDTKGTGTKEKPVFFDLKGKPRPASEVKGWNFPNWQQVMPDPKKTLPIVESLDTGRFFTVLAQANALTKGGDRPSEMVGVYLNPDGSIGITKAQPDEGNYEHNIQDGSELLAHFNNEFLMDTMRAARGLGHETVEFRLADDDGPALFRAKGMSVVIMPARASGRDAASKVESLKTRLGRVQKKTPRPTSTPRAESKEEGLGTAPVSSAQDAEYLAAVERGDMETAQRMVDEAARAAGYTTKAYHGTWRAGFTEFKPGTHFSPDRRYADRYQSTSASSMGISGPKAATNQSTYEVWLKMRKPFDTRRAASREIFNREFLGKWGNGTRLTDRGLPDWTDSVDLEEFLGEKYPGKFDSFILDEGAEPSGDEIAVRPESYVPLSPSQIKSADPVTRDEQGNVIPLSQRFNPAKDSILYTPPNEPYTGPYADIINAMSAHLADTEPTAEELAALDEFMAMPRFAEEAKVPEPKQTSIKNAVVNEERAARGLDPLPEPSRRGWDTVTEAADAQLKADPTAGQTLLEELKTRPRPITDQENALLLLHKVITMNRWKAAAEEVNSTELDSEANKQAKARYDTLADRYNEIDLYGKKAGTELGRGLNARKMLRDTEISEEWLMQRWRAEVNLGKPLSDQQKAEVKKRAAKIKRAQKAADDLDEEAQAKQAERALQRLAADMAKAGSGKREGVRAFVKNKAKAARDRIRAAMGLGTAPAGDESIEKALDSLMNSWESRGIFSFVSAKGRDITLSQIKVPKDKQGKGEGTQAMRELLELAQRRGMRVLLSPSTDFGASSKSRLEQFYMRLGFERNSGRNKDYRTRETMIWRPEGYEKLSSPTPSNISDADLAAVGAELIAEGATSPASFAEAMQKELGVTLGTDTSRVFLAAKRQYDRDVAEFERANQPKALIAAAKESGGEINLTLLTSLAKSYIRQGVRDAEELTAKIVADLQPLQPGITQSEVNRLLSGYGKTSQPSKDEAQRQLTEIKAQLRLLSGIEDVGEGKAPLKSGFQRGKPSPRVRELATELRDKMREAGIETSGEEQLASARKAVVNRLNNQLADLNAIIAGKGKRRSDQSPIEYDAEMSALLKERNELKEYVDDLTGPNAELKWNRRAQAAAKASEEYYKRRIASQDFAQKRAPEQPESAETKKARADAAKAREEFRALQEVTGNRLPEELALSKYRKYLERKRQELQNNTKAEKYLELPEPDPLFQSRRDRAKFELRQAREEWNAELFAAKLANRTPFKRLMGAAGEALNVSRAVLTSLDLSAVIRQGGFIGFGHPALVAKAFGPMFRAFYSKENEFKAMEEIKARRSYALMQQSKLYMTDMDEMDLSKMEENYMSRLANKIPLVAGSQRAYVTFLNKLRADTFDLLVETLGRDGRVTEAEGKALASFINVATGRGIIVSAERPQGTPVLSTIFFSPRLMASRFNLLFGQPMYGGTMRTRALVAQQYGRFLVGIGASLALLALFKDPDDDEPMLELDPRSADFLKARFGNTRIDMFGGLLQATVLVSRLASGQVKKKGQIVDIRGPNKPYSGDSTVDILAKFVRSKLSPAIGTAVNLAQGKDFAGEPVTPVGEAIKMTVPMSLTNIKDVMEDQGVPRGTAMTLLSLFGAGLQTYDSGSAIQVDPPFLNELVKNWNASVPADKPDDKWNPGNLTAADYVAKTQDPQTRKAVEVKLEDPIQKKAFDAMLQSLRAEQFKAKIPEDQVKKPTAQAIKTVQAIRTDTKKQVQVAMGKPDWPQRVIEAVGKNDMKAAQKWQRKLQGVTVPKTEQSPAPPSPVSSASWGENPMERLKALQRANALR